MARAEKAVSEWQQPEAAAADQRPTECPLDAASVDPSGAEPNLNVARIGTDTVPIGTP
jgi:hypothetical protein